jgi:hypothetical protein
MKLFNNVFMLRSLTRQFSTTFKLKQQQQSSSTTTTTTTINSDHSPVLIEHKNNYAILKLNRAPVNSLNLEFLTSFGIQLDKLEESKEINGIILTSVSLFC